MKPGENRDWGYVSHDVVDEEDEDAEPNFTYTSIEKDGSVNRYRDNGDGGHSHRHWDDKEDFDAGEPPDWEREESNNSKNPSIEELQNNGSCYLTTACLQHLRNNFNDKCYELELLRWFRDNYVPKEEIKHYYKIAPIIVNNINNNPNKKDIYENIYAKVVKPCVIAIMQRKFIFAYSRYKSSIQLLERKFATYNNDKETEK